MQVKERIVALEDSEVFYGQTIVVPDATLEIFNAGLVAVCDLFINDS